MGEFPITGTMVVDYFAGEAHHGLRQRRSPQPAPKTQIPVGFRAPAARVGGARTGARRARNDCFSPCCCKFWSNVLCCKVCLGRQGPKIYVMLLVLLVGIFALNLIIDALGRGVATAKIIILHQKVQGEKIVGVVSSIVNHTLTAG